MDDINRNEDEIKNYNEEEEEENEEEEEEEEEENEKEEEEEENEKEEDEYEKNKNVILERDLGDNLKIDDEKMEQLIAKGIKATCKIMLRNNNGSGFFCKIDNNGKKIKVLLTSNHVLNKESLKKGNEIKISYQDNIKMIKITDERFYRISESEILDYTCIQILDKDNIEDFYEIYNKNDNNFYNEDIAIPQYPKGGALVVKAGRFVKMNNYTIYHSVSTDKGSSGSPIILLLREFKVIGIHKGYSDFLNLNKGIYIKNIIEDINKNEIISKINISNEYLGYDVQFFNYQEKSFLSKWFKGKNLNDLKKEDIELYKDNSKIDFVWKYIFVEEKEYEIKLLLKDVLQDMSYMFSECYLLNYVNLSKFYTSQVTNMEYLFENCEFLKI